MMGLKSLLVFAGLLCVYGEPVPIVPLEPLPPINIVPDSNGHNNPVLTEGVQDKQLLGRPDGHDGQEKPLIGGQDGHDNVDQPLIGGQDGHDSEGKPLIGGQDGHDSGSKPLIGGQDGLESGSKPLIGGQDGHDSGSKLIIGGQDGHDSGSKPVIGGQDGHDFGDSSSSSSEEEELFGHEHEHEFDYTDENYEWKHNDDDDDDEWPDKLEDEYFYGDYSDGDEPLVRCPRPLCEKFCSIGYQTDDKGCPVCACLEDPCQSKKCKEDEVCRIDDCTDAKNCKALTAKCVEDVPACAMPMCANYCEHGYHYDSRGCMSCECEAAPVDGTTGRPRNLAVDCPQIDCMEHCASGYVIDSAGCTTCTCKQSTEPRFSCAEPMCANRCENGYMRNEYGCMTCDCAPNEKNCGADRCEKDEMCITRSDDVESCVPKPLCQALKEGLIKDRMASVNAPRCDEGTGKFTPQQCDRIQSECWCVDDRGVVIDGTRTSVYIDEHKPQCDVNITVAVTMQLLLAPVAGHHPAYEGQHSVSELIYRDLPIGLSYCTLIHKDFISVNKVEDLKNGQYLVKLMARNDGAVDLAAAMARLRRHTQSGSCKVALENGAVYEPNAESLTIEHRFSLLPRLPFVPQPRTGPYEEDGSWFENTYVMIFLILLAVLIVVSALLVAAHIVKRRRTSGGMNLYQHQRLESQISTNSQKSLLDARDDNVMLINNGPLGREKKPVLA